MRRAVFDFGTNSVKLLVAEVNHREVRPIWEGSEQTRLGLGLYKTHHLDSGAILRTAAAVKTFAAKAADLQSAPVRVLATSAARDARNSGELLHAIREATGLEVEIISGAAEAELAFQGVMTQSHFANRPCLLVEVGGGSTQFIVAERGRNVFHRSFQLGAVRLMEAVPHGDPPRNQELLTTRHWLSATLSGEVASQLDAPLHNLRSNSHDGGLTLVGIGGTAAVLACIEAGLDVFDRERLESTRLTLSGIQTLTERLWSLPLAERKRIVGLPPNRADLILAGAAIFEAILSQFQLGEMQVSTRGLRFAAVIGSFSSPPRAV
jgi:exopolyphosphatase/guanosine-5'-triphosphate,3'-diphosphate pyrophosphatase